jgi:hypothetical protein
LPRFEEKTKGVRIAPKTVVNEREKSWAGSLRMPGSVEEEWIRVAKDPS